MTPREILAQVRAYKSEMVRALDEMETARNDYAEQVTTLTEIEEKLMSLVMVIPAVAAATGTWVATDGNDSTGDGSIESAYLTITKARDEIRLANNISPIRLATGDYYLAGTTIEFTASDNNLTIQADDGATPVIHQGEEVTGSWTDEGGGLWSKAWSNACEDLCVDGVQAIRSRFPAWDAGDPYEATWLTVEAIDNGASTFTHRAADGMPAFTDVTDMKAVYFNHPWASEAADITGYNSGTRKFTYTYENFIRPRVGGRFYIFNIPKQASKALTQGEFWYDSVGNKVWYHDSAFVGDGSELVVAAQEVTHFALTDDNITLDGLTLTSGAQLNLAAPNWDDGAFYSRMAIRLIGANSNTIKNCTIFNVAGGVGLQDTSNSNTITTSTIYNTAGAAIGAIRGADDLTISENLIHHTNLIHRKDHTVLVEQGLRARINHNEIHHTSSAGISVTSNNASHQVDGFIIEYNHIHDTGNETADVGGIYIRGIEFGDMNGTIRYNFIENLRARNTESDGSWTHFEGNYLQTNDVPSFGIYLDDQASGVDVYGNYIKDCGHAYMRHGGFENDFFENICINCGPFDQNENKESTWPGNDWNSVRNNIFHWETSDDQPVQVLPVMNWVSRVGGSYAAHLLYDNNNYFSVDGFPNPFGIRGHTGTNMTFAEWKTFLADPTPAQADDTGSITTDPSFVDLAVDGTLNVGSPALSAPVSIPQIPFSQIGIS